MAAIEPSRRSSTGISISAASCTARRIACSSRSAWSSADFTTAATGPGVSSHTVSASISRRLARMFLIPPTNAVERICPRWR